MLPDKDNLCELLVITPEILFRSIYRCQSCRSLVLVSRTKVPEHSSRCSPELRPRDLWYLCLPRKRLSAVCKEYRCIEAALLPCFSLFQFHIICLPIHPLFLQFICREKVFGSFNIISVTILNWVRMEWLLLLYSSSKNSTENWMERCLLCYYFVFKPIMLPLSPPTCVQMQKWILLSQHRIQYLDLYEGHGRSCTLFQWGAQLPTIIVLF